MPLTFEDFLAAEGASPQAAGPPWMQAQGVAPQVPPWLAWTEGNGNPDRDQGAQPPPSPALGAVPGPPTSAPKRFLSGLNVPENAMIAANGNLPPGVVPIHPQGPPPVGLPAAGPGATPSPAPPWLEQAQQAGTGANVLAPGKPGPAPSWEQRQAAGMGEQKQAAEATIEAKRQKDQATLTAAQANDAAYQKQVEQAHATYAKAQTEAQAATAKVRADADALSKEKIDPNRYFNQMSTFGRISSAIGLAMGGFVAPKMGGKNPAMDFIQSQIHNDIQAQVSELENKRGNLNLRSNLIAQQLAQGKDMFEATTTVAASYYQRGKDMIAAQAGTMTDGEAKAALMKTWADLDQQQNQLFDAHTQQMFQNKMEQSKVGLGYAGLTQQAKFHDDQMALERQRLGLEQQQLARKGYENAIPGEVDENGNPRIAQNKEQAEHIIDVRVSTNKVFNTLDKLDHLVSQHGAQLDNVLYRTEIAKEMKTLKAIATPQLLAAMGGDKRIHDKLLEIADTEIGDPTSLRSAITNIKTTKSALLGAATTEIRGRLLGAPKEYFFKPDLLHGESFGYEDLVEQKPADLAAGRAQLVDTKNNRVLMVGPDGEWGTVPVSQMNARLAKGYRVPSSTEVVERYTQRDEAPAVNPVDLRKQDIQAFGGK